MLKACLINMIQAFLLMFGFFNYNLSIFAVAQSV